MSQYLLVHCHLPDSAIHSIIYSRCRSEVTSQEQLRILNWHTDNSDISVVVGPPGGGKNTVDSGVASPDLVGVWFCVYEGLIEDFVIINIENKKTYIQGRNFMFIVYIHNDCCKSYINSCTFCVS